jgi:hypothetical protein
MLYMYMGHCLITFNPCIGSVWCNYFHHVFKSIQIQKDYLLFFISIFILQCYNVSCHRNFI